jgi:hypothetical protein
VTLKRHVFAVAIPITALLLAGAAKGELKAVQEPARNTKDGIVHSQGNAPAESQPIILAQAHSGAPATKAGASPRPGEETLPDLAVDDTVVAQQQEAVRTTCEEDARTHVSMDCACMVGRYPDFRLRELSKAIRGAEVQRDRQCGISVSSRFCKKAVDEYAKLTSREGQIEFNAIAIDTSHFYLEELPNCKNSAALGKQVAEQCLGGMHPPLPPGKSTKEFCACVGEHYQKGFETAEGTFSSSLDVRLKTAAWAACRK